MSNGDLANAQWFKSSYSNDQGACVEVAFMSGAVAMRDSKNPGGPALVLTPEQFNAFVRSVSDAEFNAA